MTAPDERLLDDEAWAEQMRAALHTHLRGSAVRRLGLDRAARIEQAARLVALLRRGQVALEIVSNDASRAALPKLQWDIIHEAIRDIRRELEARP